MLTSYNRPTDAVIALDAASGSAVLADPQRLINGRPADFARLTWRSDAGDVFINASWSSRPIVPRLVGLIFPNLPTALPPGVLVKFFGNVGGGFIYDLGGNSQVQHTMTLANGAVAIWVACSLGLSGIQGVQAQIVADTWTTLGQTVDVGEFWFGEGADFPFQQFNQKLMGGLLQRQSHNNQAWPLEVQAWRQLVIGSAPIPEEFVLGGGPQDDFETVINNLNTQSATVIVPGYLKRGSYNAQQLPKAVDTTTIDVQRLHRLARLGVVDTPIELDINASNSTFFTSPITFGETPP